MDLVNLTQNASDPEKPEVLRIPLVRLPVPREEVRNPGGGWASRPVQFGRNNATDARRRRKWKPKSQFSRSP